MLFEMDTYEFSIIEGPQIVTQCFQWPLLSFLLLHLPPKYMQHKKNIPLQKPIPMPIDQRNRLRVRNADMQGLDPDKLAIFLVRGVNG